MSVCVAGRGRWGLERSASAPDGSKEGMLYIGARRRTLLRRGVSAVRLPARRSNSRSGLWPGSPGGGTPQGGRPRSVVQVPAGVQEFHRCERELGVALDARTAHAPAMLFRPFDLRANVCALRVTKRAVPADGCARAERSRTMRENAVRRLTRSALSSLEQAGDVKGAAAGGCRAAGIWERQRACRPVCRRAPRPVAR